MRTSSLLLLLALTGCEANPSSGTDESSTSDGTSTASPTSTPATTDPSTTESAATTDDDLPASSSGTTEGPDESSSGAPPSDGGDPLYESAAMITIDANGDETDVYIPEADGSFAVAVMLQGANVDKQYYGVLASTVARYGFVVAVPNHLSAGFMGEGLFMEQEVILDVLAAVEAESNVADSPLEGAVDISAVGLIGHSYGGVVGMYALTDQCTPPFCSPPFMLPASVRGGAFYGTNMRPPFGGAIEPLPNAGRGVTLIQGTVDGAAVPADGLETFEALQSPPAAYVTLLGANHYGNADENNPPGAAPDSSAPTLDQADGLAAVSRFTGVSLRAWVLDDADALAYLQAPTDPNVVVTLER